MFQKYRNNKLIHKIFYYLLFFLSSFIVWLFLVSIFTPLEEGNIEAKCIFEYAFLCVLYILFVLVLNRFALAFGILALIYTFLLILNNFVSNIYGRSIRISDFFLWFDFKYLFHYFQVYFRQAILLTISSASLLIIISVVLFKFFKRGNVVFKRGTIRVLAGVTLIVIISQIMAVDNIKKIDDFVSRMCRFSAICVHFPLTSILIQIPHFINIDESLKQDSSQYNSLNKRDDTSDKIETNVDIIVVLNESIFDPSFIEMAKDKKFDIFEENSNSFEVQVFGGKTWNTQFQVLTGIDLEFFKEPVRHNPYLLFKYSANFLPHLLKTYQYKPYVITNLSRYLNGQGETFHKYGFEEYYDVESISNMENKRDYCNRDNIIYGKIKDLLSSNQQQNKFIYVETMCNHGPHKENLDIQNENCKGLNRADCSKVLDYINRLDIVNNQMKDLIKYIKHNKKKTLLVYFGDHYPSLEGGMKRILEKYNKDPYKTFYSVKSNFAINTKLLVPIKAAEMPNLILKILETR